MSGFDTATEARVEQTLADSSLYSLATEHRLAMKATAERGEVVAKRDYASFAEVHEIPGECVRESVIGSVRLFF